MIWLAVVGFVLVAVAVLWLRAKKVDRTPAEVAKYLRDFIDGTGGDWDWDAFTSISIKDPELERIRDEAERVQLPVEYFDRLNELLSEAEALAKAEGEAAVGIASHNLSYARTIWLAK